ARRFPRRGWRTCPRRPEVRWHGAMLRPRSLTEAAGDNRFARIPFRPAKHTSRVGGLFYSLPGLAIEPQGRGVKTTRGALDGTPLACNADWKDRDDRKKAAGGTRTGRRLGVSRVGFRQAVQPFRPSGRSPPGSRKDC